MTIAAKFSATLMALSLAFVSAPAKAQDFQVQITSEFTETPLAFTGGVADPFIANWNMMAHQGQLALCGSGFLRDARFGSTIRGMARDGAIQVDGAIRPVDLTFFTRARSARDLRSGTATCRLVGPLPSTNAGIGLRYGAGNLRN